MSKQYKGIIFNSVTVRALRGRLAEAVLEILARKGHPKEDVRRWVEDNLGYDFSTPMEEIRRQGRPEGDPCGFRREIRWLKGKKSISLDAGQVAAPASSINS